MYGLNITKMTKNDKARLNHHARSFLKLMFGVSKHARDTLRTVFNLKNATDVDVIDDQSNTTLRQLVHNTSASSYVLHLLTLPTKERLYLDKQFYQQTTNRHTENSPDNQKNTQISWCTKLARRNHPIGPNTAQNWHLVANRAKLKAVLENRIERRL